SPPQEKSASSGIPAELVDLNTATLEELETLPGIGATRAQQIIDYRQAHGGFKTIDELDNVSGIGPATLEKLRPFITVN
ncbi:MAG: helix-hairpin-helix domain-containing protein, partial [Chloroflexi bacterium]